jgi:hypothetical protein
MNKHFTIFFMLIIIVGCTPKAIPGPEGTQGATGKEGSSGQTGEQGMQGPPGPKGQSGKSVSAELVNSLKEKLELLDQTMQDEEKICSLISYKAGIAPPILGFAALTTGGKVLIMKNSSPISIGDKFVFSVQIADRTDFISMSVLTGTEGEKTFYVAITSDGYHYYSEDLKRWNPQGQSSF